MTPVASPGEERAAIIPKTRDTSAQAAAQDKTRIASILGIDANPRSPKEREMVRRMEEERCGVAVGA